MVELTDIALYDYIYTRRYEMKFSWQDISDALQLGLSGESTRKKFSRLADKLNKPYKPPSNAKPSLRDQIRNEANTQTPPSNTIDSTIDEDSDEDVLITIDRVRYGDMPPTLYISPLSHDEWIAKYVPHMTWKLDYLTELRNVLWESMDLLVLLPRNHGKSDTVTALFVRWILEVRAPILLLTASASLGKDIFLMVEDLLTTPEIREDYGDVLGSANRSDMKMYYVDSVPYRYRDAMFRAATQQSRVKGAHPTWIHFDDVIDGQYQNVHSNTEVERWYDRSIKPMRRYTDVLPTRITGTVTRQGIDDFYKFLIDKRNFDVLHKKALWLENDEWQTLNCPNFPIDILLDMKNTDPIGFAEQMQNDPMPQEGIYFSDKDWREYVAEHIHFDASKTTWYMAVDPANGMSDKADFTAIMVFAIQDGMLYVHDGIVERGMRFEEKKEHILQLRDKYSPSIIHIEKIMAQQLLHQAMEHLPEVRAFTHTAANAKYQRIDAIPFAKHVVYVNRDAQFYEELIREYRSYDQTPSTASRKDDALDCISMIIFKHGRYLGSKTIDWSKTKLYV